MRGMTETYSGQEQRQSGYDSHHEDSRDRCRDVFGLLLENVVDLRLFAVAERLRDGGGCRDSIRLDIDIESVGNEALR